MSRTGELVDLVDVPTKSRRRSAARRPEDLPPAVEAFGEPGGFRYELTRLDPTYKAWPGRRKPWTESEVKALGEGIYELQTWRQDAGGKWRRYGQPRQLEVEAPPGAPDPWAGAKPGAGGAPGAELYLARELLAEVRSMREPRDRDPYRGQREPVVPASTLDELERRHRDQVDEIRRDHAERIEAQRMLWGERLEAARGQHKGLESVYASRIEELQARIRTLEAEAVELRSRKSDPTSDLIRSLDLRDRLVERLAPEVTGEADGWVGQLIQHAPALLDRWRTPTPAQRPPSPTVGALPAVPEAPPASPASDQAAVVLVAMLDEAHAAGLSPVDAYQEIAPGLTPDAVRVAASAPPEAFAEHLLALAAPDSQLRTPQGRQWLGELHALIARISAAGRSTTPAAPPS